MVARYSVLVCMTVALLAPATPAQSVPRKPAAAKVSVPVNQMDPNLTDPRHLPAGRTQSTALVYGQVSASVTPMNLPNASFGTVPITEAKPWPGFHILQFPKDPSVLDFGNLQKTKSTK